MEAGSDQRGNLMKLAADVTRLPRHCVPRNDVKFRGSISTFQIMNIMVADYAVSRLSRTAFSAASRDALTHTGSVVAESLNSIRCACRKSRRRP